MGCFCLNCYLWSAGIVELLLVAIFSTTTRVSIGDLIVIWEDLNVVFKQQYGDDRWEV